MKKYPAYENARNRVNSLIIHRLMDKNSKPTPQKVLTRPGDWTKVGSGNVLASDPIPYEILINLNIRLGLLNVLETGTPPPLPPISSPNFSSNTTSPSPSEPISTTSTFNPTTQGNYSFL